MSKLTVIISFHNAIKHKDILLANIRRNAVLDINFIIIDDSSKDNLLNLIKNESIDTDILFIKNPKKYGISKSRNIGINNCQSDFLLFCDVDDSLDLNPLNDLNMILNKKFDFQIFNRQYTNKINRVQDSVNHGYQGILNSANISKLVIAYLHSPVGRSILIHCWGCIYNRKFLIENGISFNESLDKYEDSLFVSKVLTTSKCINISNINIYSYWTHDSGLSHTSQKSVGKFNQHIEVYYEYLINIKIKNVIELKHSAISYYLSRTLVQLQHKGFIYIFLAINKILSEETILESIKSYKIQCLKMPLIKNWMFKSKLIISCVLTLYGLKNKTINYFSNSAKPR